MRVLAHRLVALAFATVLVGVVGGMTAPAASAESSRSSVVRTATPERWVRTVCTTLSQWYDDTGSLDQQLVDTIAAVDRGSMKPLKAQFLLIQVAKKAVKATDGMIGKVKKVGTPDVTDGKAIAKRYLSGLADFRSVYDRVRVGFVDLKTKTTNEFLTGANRVNTRAGNGFDDVGDVMEELWGNDDLSVVLDAEPACDDLASDPVAVILEVGSCVLADDVANLVPCSDPHLGEIFAMPSVTDMLEGQLGQDAGPSSPYPGEVLLQSVSDVLCGANFNEFVGATYEESEFDYGHIAPSEDDWVAGERRTICVLYRDDQQPFVGSAQGLG